MGEIKTLADKVWKEGPAPRNGLVRQVTDEIDDVLAAKRNLAPSVVVIANDANQTFDAQDGATEVARQTATDDRTLVAPTNPVDGQIVRMELIASGGDRTWTLTTGSAGAFRFGTDITGLTITSDSTKDIVSVSYVGVVDRWDVIAYVKGFA
jgi:hypothetical protein